MENSDELMAEIIQWSTNITKKEAHQAGGENRAPITYIHDMADLMESPQLKERGFLREIEHPVAGKATYPGPPWWMGPDNWTDNPAPLLGANTKEILEGLVR